MTDWLKYEWIWQEQSAVFRVDMQYWNLLPVLSYTQLITVCVTAKRPGGRFRATDHYFFNILRKRLIEKLSGKVIYVGGVTVDSARNLYFYTNNASSFHEVSELCLGFKSLLINCTHSYEEDFSTYYTILYPDDAKLQSLENAEFIKSLRKKETELSLVHRVRMTAAFINESERARFMAYISAHGFITGECFTQEHPSHTQCCYIYGYAQLNLSALNRLTTRLIAAAAPNEGLLCAIDCD